MNDTILVALIGSGGVVIGAASSFLASFFSTKQKLKEIELTYYQKLDETHLSNARQHIETLYIPLTISLTQLADQFDVYIRTKQLSKIDKEENLKVFREGCIEFTNVISQLFNQGQDAYLTIRLERQLRAFTKFIKDSTNVKSLNIFRVVYIFFTDLEEDIKKDTSNIENNTSKLKIENKVKYIAVPFTSRHFQLQFEYGIYKLKSLIKEVTLGTVPPKT